MTQLIDNALEQIKKDVADGDLTAIEELLKHTTTIALEGYLADDNDGKLFVAYWGEGYGIRESYIMRPNEVITRYAEETPEVVDQIFAMSVGNVLDLSDFTSKHMVIRVE